MSKIIVEAMYFLKIQISPDLVAQIQSLSHLHKVATLWLFYRYFIVIICMSSSLCFLDVFDFICSTRLVSRSYQFTIKLARCRRKFHANSLLSRNSCLLNSLPAPWFPANFNLQKLKCNFNGYLLSFLLHFSLPAHY